MRPLNRNSPPAISSARRTRPKLIAATVMGVSMMLVSSAANSDLQAFYNSISTFNNVGGPSAYQGQTMNLYTGGSMYLRTPNRSYNLASISPPGYNAGCGGIDIWGGSFSFINKTQFVAMMRNIAQNAVGHFFMLAIQSLSPDIANVQKYLRDAAAFMNKMNVDSCTEGKAWAQGLAEKVLDKEKLASVWDNQARSVFSDYADAIGSQTAADSNASLNNRKADPKQAEQVSEGNLTWRSLKASGVNLVLNNQESLEWIMSASGTLVIRRDPDNAENWQVKWYEPRISVSTLMGATNATTVYACEQSAPAEGCLAPNEIPAPAVQSLRVIVKQYVDSIKSKMLSRTALTSSELAFIGTAPTPIYKIISIAASPGGSVADLLTDNNIDVIALAYAQNILGMALKDVSSGLAAREVKAAGLEAGEIDKAKQQIDTLRTQIYQESQTMKADLNAIYTMTQQAQAVEKMMWGGMSDKVVSNIRFGVR